MGLFTNTKLACTGSRRSPESTTLCTSTFVQAVLAGHAGFIRRALVNFPISLSRPALSDTHHPTRRGGRLPLRCGTSFTSLPYELRSHIWSLAVEPRRITGVRAVRSSKSITIEQPERGQGVLYETASAPPPAVMQVCRESRQHAPYRRAFTAGTQPRWIWVNFDVDVFCVSSLYGIQDIISHRPELRRLRIRTDDDRDWYESATTYNVLRILIEFPNLSDIQIVMQPGDPWWAGVYWDWGVGGFPDDVLHFIDEGSGLVLTGPQLKMHSDWHFVFSFDVEGNPPAEDELQEQIEFAADTSWHLTLAQMREID